MVLLFIQELPSVVINGKRNLGSELKLRENYRFLINRKAWKCGYFQLHILYFSIGLFLSWNGILYQCNGTLGYQDYTENVGDVVIGNHLTTYVVPSCHGSKEIPTCYYGIVFSWNDVTLSYVKHENCSIYRTCHLWNTYITYWPVKPSKWCYTNSMVWMICGAIYAELNIFRMKNLASILQMTFSKASWSVKICELSESQWNLSLKVQWKEISALVEVMAWHRTSLDNDKDFGVFFMIESTHRALFTHCDMVTHICITERSHHWLS